MKLKAFILFFCISLNSAAQNQLFLVDLILIKYLPEYGTNEKFSTPSIKKPKQITFLAEFPYPELRVNTESFNLDYLFKDLFMSVKIDEDSDPISSKEEALSDEKLIPILEEKKSIFEIDSAREFSMSSEVTKIARSRDFRVIGTKSWFQEIKSRKEAEYIFLDSKFFKGTRIFGFLQLYKERFLHFSSNLYLSELDPTAEWDENFISGRNVFDEEIILNLFEDKNQKVLYEIQHSKKFRSGELHYVDHPKFGMLIKLTKAQKEISSPDNGLTKN